MYVKEWGYGNDPERPAKVISVGKAHPRGSINIVWRDHNDVAHTSKDEGFLFHDHELEEWNPAD